MSERESERMQEANNVTTEAESSEDGAEARVDATTDPVDERSTAPTQDTAASGDVQDEHAPLLAGDEAERFRRRWDDVQTGFVDEPRQMVEEANELVGELMQQLTAGFGEQRSSLEAQWDRGEDVSTEDLRVALTRYRSFFNRLLSA